MDISDSKKQLYRYIYKFSINKYNDKFDTIPQCCKDIILKRPKSFEQFLSNYINDKYLEYKTDCLYVQQFNDQIFVKSFIFAFCFEQSDDLDVVRQRKFIYICLAQFLQGFTVLINNFIICENIQQGTGYYYFVDFLDYVSFVSFFQSILYFIEDSLFSQQDCAQSFFCCNEQQDPNDLWIKFLSQNAIEFTNYRQIVIHQFYDLQYEISKMK